MELGWIRSQNYTFIKIYNPIISMFYTLRDSAAVSFSNFAGIYTHALSTVAAQVACRVHRLVGNAIIFRHQNTT